MFRDYFKFCVIRDPLDRAVSAFYFFEKLRCSRAGEHIERPFDGLSAEEQARLIRSWLLTGLPVSLIAMCTLWTGKPVMEYYIRYEDLHSGIREVCERLDIPFEPERLPRAKSGLSDNRYLWPTTMAMPRRGS